MAVADASFKIEKLSMVSAGILSKSPVAISTSSSKIKGVAPPPKVDTPRIKNSEAVPGSPLLVLTITPANLPAIELVNEELGALSSNPFTVEIAPVTLTFFCVPDPTITTSSSISLSEVNLISIIPEVSTGTSRVL